jgi:SAM-dependent methyltransferase
MSDPFPGEAMTANGSASMMPPAEARSVLLRYVADVVATPALADSVARRAARLVLPRSLRAPVRRFLTDAVGIRERRKAPTLACRHPLQFQLGSGKTPKSGWVNIDLVGDPVDLAWNCERRLPFGDATVDALFHEHLLEHLPLKSGLDLTLECYRLLKPGGILRVGVPDVARLLRSWLDQPSDFVESVRPGRPTPFLAVQEVFYCCGHRTMYDFETLALLCRAAGFEMIEQRDFGDSRLSPCPDSEHRRSGTLYVEAVK